MITAGDFLAGGGGVTFAMTQIPGLECKWVLNHNATAIKTNMINNAGIKHYLADFFTQDEKEMETVDFVWASIECTQHSKAKGGKAKDVGSYTMGWEMVRYITHIRPKLIGIENVPEFMKWTPVTKKGKPHKGKIGKEFERWKKAICDLGYKYSDKIMNAADYGIPTRRVRYFAFFVRNDVDIDISFPEPTHNKKGDKGLLKWVPCKHYIDTTDEGKSIFGRDVPLVTNTLRRIAGGIKKFHPELFFIFQYYGTGLNVQSLDAPLNTVTTKDRHVLVKLEKLQFIQDHCINDLYADVESPMPTQLTRQTKQLITFDGYNRENNTASMEKPMTTITSTGAKRVITSEIQFVSVQNNSNGKPELNNASSEEPLAAISTKQKHQFISTYFNSGGNPESQNQSIESPLNAITTGTNKAALATVDEMAFDFDIKMRFITPEELARVSTFPEKYFSHPGLKLSVKEKTKLIGNAVPPEWARIIIKPMVEKLQKIKG